MSSRCSVCPHTHRCVPPDGPENAVVFCIGEAPGYDEDNEGRPFIGRAGREFNEHYLRLAGLTRDEIYITNTVQCRPDQNRKPRYSEVWGCAPNHIPGELERVKPEVVVLMGGTACSLLEKWGGKPDLDAEHGIPRRGRLFDWEGWVVPINHPAIGLHDSSMMTPLMEDWRKLKEFFYSLTAPEEESNYLDSWPWAVDRLEGKRDYRLLDSKWQVDRYFGDHFPFTKLKVGADTESHAGKEHSVQISIEEGSGGLVLWENTEVVKYLADTLRGFKELELLFHYAPADQPMFEQMGLGGIAYRDTLQEAYQLLQPQALKTLSRRLLGRKRLSWEETVTPPSKKVLAKWMRDAVRYAEENWLVVEKRTHKKTGKPLKDKVKESAAQKLMTELYGYMLGNPEYRIWDKIRERVPDEMRFDIERALRPMPVKGVAHLTIEQLVEYGCSDADDTLTLGIMFERMRAEFVERLNFQSEDRDQ